MIDLFMILLKTSMFLCLQNEKFVLSDAAAAPGPGAQHRGHQTIQKSQRWEVSVRSDGGHRGVHCYVFTTGTILYKPSVLLRLKGM